MSPDAPPLPPAAVLVRHPVADWNVWKAGFDAHEPERIAAGMVGHHINRAEDDPNMVTIYFAVADVEKTKAFAASDELKQIMQEVGVTAPAEISWMTPAREAVVWDRELPAMIVSHTVADFDSWLEGYNAADELREQKGITGHAASRSMDEPSRVFVYHQAESFDTLRAFMADPELHAAMKAVGVSSEPEVSYHTGNWAKLYA